MSGEQIVVPNGMLESAMRASVNAGLPIGRSTEILVILEAALLWLTENPIVPTKADVMNILQERVETGHITGEEYCAIPPATVRFVVREWQRRMFLAPEPEIPILSEEDHLKIDLLTNGHRGRLEYEQVRKIAEDAYRLGQKNPQ